MYNYTVAKNQIEIGNVLTLAKKIYAQQGYTPDSATENSFEKFLMSSSSKTFLALVNNKLFGTISVIIDSPLGLPMDALYRAELTTLRQSKQIAEVSQFAVDHQVLKQEDPDFVSSKQLTATLPLLSLVLHYTFYQKLDFLCIAISPKHDAFYRNLGFQELGQEKFYSTVKTIAVARILDLNKLPHATNLPGFMEQFIHEPFDYNIFK